MIVALACTQERAVCGLVSCACVRACVRVGVRVEDWSVSSVTAVVARACGGALGWREDMLSASAT